MYTSKKVLYIGNRETYNLFTDIANKTETTISVYYAVSKTKEEIINKALEEPYAMIILNIAELVVAKEYAAEIIKAISSGSKTKLIVMAQGYSPKSSIVIEAAQYGVKYFMLSTNASELKETFVNTLAGIKNVDKIIDVYDMRNNIFMDNNSVNKNKFTYTEVAVAGCINRIGVTSVAIQLIRFFKSFGKTACYIDNTDTDYISLCKNYYYCDNVDEELHMITIDGIDIYYDLTAEIMKNVYIKNYDFMVYDVGNINDNPQKQTLFLQKKFRLLVTGQKPNEIHALNKLIDSMYNTNISYLFNFVPRADRDDVIEDTKDKGTAYFVPFFDDCFSLTSESIPLFSDIFSEYIPKKEFSEPLSKAELKMRKKEERKKKKEYRKQRKNSKAVTINEN